MFRTRPTADRAFVRDGTGQILAVDESSSASSSKRLRNLKTSTVEVIRSQGEKSPVVELALDGSAATAQIVFFQVLAGDVFGRATQ